MSRAAASVAGRNLMLAGLMAAAALAAAVMRDAAKPAAGPDIDLAKLVPERFSSWQIDADSLVSPIQAEAAPAATGTYAQTLERVYRDADGSRIMLSIAYGSQQRGDRLQAHRPEYCYRAQGFEVLALSDDSLHIPGGNTLPVRRLLAERPGRSEPVSYWLTVGNRAALPGLSRKLAQVGEVFSGRVPDGVLVRVSSIDPVARDAYRQHDRFITDLLSGLAGPGRERLAGRSAAAIPSPWSPT